MVYGTQITIVTGAYKPTNITGGGTLYSIIIWHVPIAGAPVVLQKEIKSGTAGVFRELDFGSLDFGSLSLCLRNGWDLACHLTIVITGNLSR